MPTSPSADEGRDAKTLVLATRANRHDIRRLARHERRANALWPVPTLFALGALVAAILMVALDDRLHLQARHDRLLVGDTSTALTLTSVVATGMLAFLGIVFATTLVAIQLAASQYSPRVVRVFVRSRLTKISLGIFIATFVFSIITLIAIRTADDTQRGFTPVLSIAGVAILVVATLVTFLVFAHGTVRLLRVQYLIERVADETGPTLLAAFPVGDDVVEVRRPDPVDARVRIDSRSHGVIDAVDVGDLAVLAAQLDGWIDVVAPIGSYVGQNTTIAIAHPGPQPRSSVSADSIAREVHDCLLLSNERSLLQDPGFGFRQLVDIAIRALSPAVNDPTTGVQATDRLTDLLGRIVHRPDPTGWHVDATGVVRVRLPVDSFDELSTLAFTEIIRYGSDSPQVVRRLRASFGELTSDTTDLRAGIHEMRRLLDAAVDELGPDAFASIGRVADTRGLG